MSENKLSLRTVLLMVIGTGLIQTILLYMMRDFITSLISIPNTYYVFIALLTMFLAQIFIVAIAWSREGLLGNWNKLKERYPYLKFSLKNQSLTRWLIALAVATITFIIAMDLIEPTVGVWFRTIVIPPNWHPIQPNMPMDIKINGLFVVIMGLVIYRSAFWSISFVIPALAGSRDFTSCCYANLVYQIS